jgi:hypothetical protein
MAQELAGRTALVTGGSRGIGRAVCVRLAREGARIALNYTSNEDAARAAITDFVDAYNATKQFINAQRQGAQLEDQAEETVGALRNEPILSDVESRLSRVLGIGAQNVDGDLEVLGQIGIDFVDNASLSDKTREDTLTIDDAELDRKKVAAMFAGFVTRPGPDDVMGEDSAQKDQDGAALIGLQPGTMQLLLPGEDIKFSDPADVGGSYEAFQYRTLLACCSAMGVPYTNVTGDLRQANYSSLREGKLEFRRRIEQFQHGTLVFQLCRPVWRRWIRDAVLSGALELPGFAQDPASYRAVKWIPPKWDWVDPLKDRKAEIEAIEAGLKSRSDVIESEGYDAEEVDRRIAADHAREEELGLKFGRPATTRAEPAAGLDPEDRERPMQSEENAA